jgi:hypothetical protein
MDKVHDLQLIGSNKRMRWGRFCSRSGVTTERTNHFTEPSASPQMTKRAVLRGIAADCDVARCTGR